MPKVAILIVSYIHDLPYLRWNLQSIDKFCSGFSGVTLVVPHDEVSEFASLAAAHKCQLRPYARTNDQSRWHLHSQVQKCFADIHCPGADYVLHTDSDCIFDQSVTPEDYFVKGKPYMVIESYSRLKGNPWKEVTEKSLGFPVEYETMRMHPQVNPIRIYPYLRYHIEATHRMRFENYVLSQRGGFPFGFSEHNAIGAFAKQFHPNWYHWIDVGKEPWPKEKLIQFWSVSPPDKKQASPHGEPDRVPLEVIQKVLAS